jgi:hypothetical protein
MARHPGSLVVGQGARDAEKEKPNLKQFLLPTVSNTYEGERRYITSRDEEPGLVRHLEPWSDGIAKRLQPRVADGIPRNGHY